MNRIGIVTLVGNYNIGNRLQNYAVQELCRQYGFEPTTLAYCQAKRLKWWEPIVAKLGWSSDSAERSRRRVKRENAFKRFSDRYIMTEKPVPFSKFDSAKVENLKAVIAGSDQIWHNWSNTQMELDYFFLRFVPEEKRLCLAPSFGFDAIPEKFRSTYVEGLKGLPMLSCRESNGCDLIHKLTGRTAEHLIDPTMMFDAEQWDMISRKPDYHIPDKFMLVYFLRKTPLEAQKRYVDFAQKHGLEMIDIYNPSCPQYYSTAPDEFLYLIKRAACVCTNSFHGCAFSILYQKPLAVFQSSDAAGINMNSRLISLLTKFKMEQCLTNMDALKSNFTYLDTMKVLKEERDKERNYLQIIFEHVENVSNNQGVEHKTNPRGENRFGG